MAFYELRLDRVGRCHFSPAKLVDILDEMHGHNEGIACRRPAFPNKSHTPRLLAAQIGLPRSRNVGLQGRPEGSGTWPSASEEAPQ